jgi:DNA-binding CsgD family transcriptional regulator
MIFAVYHRCVAENGGGFHSMLSIVVFNDEGNVLYQNIVSDVQDLVKTIHEGGVLPGYSESTPAVRVNGLIILAEQALASKRAALKLTAKQCMVLQCLASSLTPEQTAIRMGISEPTVRLHIRLLKKKFNTESRDQLMAMAGSLGLCDPFQIETPKKI